MYVRLALCEDHKHFILEWVSIVLIVYLLHTVTVICSLAVFVFEGQMKAYDYLEGSIGLI